MIGVCETAEEVLGGGLTNAGRIVRVGDTVRRPLRPTSAATHALLAHLEAQGFDGAPRVLGTDAQGREVLTYIEGQTVVPPYPDWALTDAALDSVAELLRDFHEAVAGFDPSGHVWAEAVPPAYVDGTVSHNDPNLDNLVFRDGRAVALIDFDLAGPGSVAWDVACAARLWAPLRRPEDQPVALRGQGLARLRRFADAYGLPATARDRVAEALPVTQDWAYSIVVRAIGDGHESFARMWVADGGRSLAERTQEWLAAHVEDAREALRA